LKEPDRTIARQVGQGKDTAVRNDCVGLTSGEVRRMVPVVTDIIEETSAIIHPLPFRAAQVAQPIRNHAPLPDRRL
jgi:hypothetical protein